MHICKLPFISILIPNYFIKKTLDSIKEDTCEKEEIIIINSNLSNHNDSWIDQNLEIKINDIKRENNTKLEDELDWKASKNLDCEIVKTIKWHMKKYNKDIHG